MTKALRESRILSWLVQVFLVVYQCARQSVFWRGCRRIGRAFGRSQIIGFFRRDGFMYQNWPSSISCGVLSACVNCIPTGLKKFYGKVGKHLEASACFRGLAWLGEHMYVPMGVFLVLMMVAPHSLWNNLYAFLGALVLLALLFVGVMRHKTVRLDAENLGPYLPIYMLFLAYGFVASVSQWMSLRFVAFYATAFLLVLVFLSSMDRKTLQKTLAFLLAAVTVVSLYGIYQMFSGNLTVNASEVDLSLELNATIPGRVYSTFDNANNFAEILLLTMPFFAAMFLNCKNKWGKLCFAGGFCLALVAMLMTYSRSGWISLAVAVFVFVLLTNWRAIPVLILLALVALPFLPQSIINRILTIGNMEDSSTSYRFQIYEAFFRMLKDRWLIGTGLGSDAVYEVIRTYPTMSNGYFPLHAHNNYIQMWAELGIGGAFAFIAMWFGNIKQGIKTVTRRRCNRETRNILIAGVSAMCGLAVMSIAEYTWYYPRVMFTFWVVFAITAVAVKIGKQEEKTGD